MPKLILIILLIMIHAFGMVASPLQEIDSLQAQLNVTQDDEKAQTLLHLSEAYRNIMFNDCIDYGTQAFELADELNNSSLKALVLKSLGVSSYYSGNMDIGLDYFLQSCEIYKQIEDKKGQANCLNNIGLIYEKWADFDNAISYLVQSYEIEVVLDNKKGMAISLLQIGNISYHKGSYQEALDNYYQALLISTDIDDVNGIAYAYNSIGIIYGKWKKFDKALEYYQKAKELYFQTGNKRALSQVLTNMAEVYNFEYKDYNTALQIYNEALQIKNSIEDKVGIALLNNNLGTLYANMEDDEKALVYFETSLKMYNETGVSTGVVMVNYNLGELYQNVNKTDKAIEYFIRSLNMAKQNGQIDFIVDNYDALVHCYAKQGDYSNFEHYYRLLSIGNDSLINKLHELELVEMEVKYKVEESIKEGIQLLKENEKQQVEIKKYKLLLTGLAGLVILVMFIYILFLKIRKK